MEAFEDWIDYFREQRHDFMNELQVIYGYLQVDEPENARKYIEKIVSINKKISKIYFLGDNCFGVLMEEKFKSLLHNGVELDMFIEIDSWEINFKNCYNKKKNLVNNIFDEFENNKYKFVHIYIFEDEIGKSVLVANNESVVDELDWMDEWKEVDSDITDIKVHKYFYNGNCGYRLTFL